jgi:WD40 repeat protein
MGEPVLARPITRVTRAWRWGKRNPAWAIAISLVILLAVGGPVAAVKYASLASDLTSTSAAERVSRLKAEELLYIADMARAQIELEKANITEVINLLERQAVTDMVLSPDGSVLALGTLHGSVHLFDIKRQVEVGCLPGHLGGVGSLTFSLDGKGLFVADSRSVRFWDIDSAKSVFELNAHNDDITFLAVSPDETTLITGSGDKTVKVWRGATAGEVEQMRQRWQEMHEPV